MTNPLLLVGCGGHARALIDIAESSSQWHLAGLVGLPHQVGGEVLGYPVLGSDEDLASLRKVYRYAFLAVGQLPSSNHRVRLHKKLDSLDYLQPTLISSHAYVSSNAFLGEGTSVGHGAIVNAGASVGNQCIINSQSLIEHDCFVGDFCHISTGVLVNGGVKIGSGSFIGSGVVLRDGLTLPPNTVISAGKRVMGWPNRDLSKL